MVNNLNNQIENCSKYRKLNNEIKHPASPSQSEEIKNQFKALAPHLTCTLPLKSTRKVTITFTSKPHTIREESLSNIREVTREVSGQEIRIGYVGAKALLMQKKATMSLAACVGMRLLDFGKTPNWAGFNSPSANVESLKDILSSGLALKTKNVDLTKDLLQLDEAIKEFGPAILRMECAQHYVIIDDVAKDHSTVTIRDPDRAIMASIKSVELLSFVNSSTVQLKLITQKK